MFAVACGISAANLYYAQPLLPLISRDLHAGAGATALVVTAAQVGYGVGLALIVPLGDILIRRRLVPAILLVAAGALLVGAAAPDLVVLLVAVAVAGLCSVAAQILVPYAAELATDQQRGRVVGTVMSGLLLGILLARAFSGVIAEAAGLARRIRCRRRGGVGSRRRPQSTAAGRAKSADPRLLATARISCSPDAHPAPAPLAVCHRRLGVRNVQCDLDQPGLLAGRLSLPLPRSGDRPVRVAWRRRVPWLPPSVAAWPIGASSAG